jgi:hypothetical protein
MSQVGVIVLGDDSNSNINVEAWINKVKEENPKYKVGTVQIGDNGSKYIPIEKSS